MILYYTHTYPSYIPLYHTTPPPRHTPFSPSPYSVILLFVFSLYLCVHIVYFSWSCVLLPVCVCVRARARGMCAGCKRANTPRTIDFKHIRGRGCAYTRNRLSPRPPRSSWLSARRDTFPQNGHGNKRRQYCV